MLEEYYEVIKCLPLIKWCFILLLLISSNLSPASATPKKNADKISQADLRKIVPAITKAFTIKYLGFTDTDQFVIVINYDYLDGIGAFKWIDPRSATVVRSVPVDTLSADTPVLSSDGRILFCTDNAAYLLGRINRSPVVNHTHVYSSKDFKLLKSLDIGPSRDTCGVAGVPTHQEQEVVWEYLLVPDLGSLTAGTASIELWDWKKDQLIRRSTQPDALHFDSVLFSPDESKLCCYYADMEADCYGLLQLLDTSFSKILWQTQGNQQRSVAEPIFFLPNGNLVSKNTVYDFTDAIGKPLLLGHPDLRCVSGVLSRYSLVFFQSSQGLELWNIRKRILTKRWPGIKNIASVYLSPDYSVMAIITSTDSTESEPISYSKNTSLQFWHFDRTLLHY